MAVRSLQQIVNELNKADSGQISSLQKRQTLIPQQIASEEKGLAGKQEQAFGQILGGARQRGLGFSGIPLSEQAKYTSTEYLPALARLRQQGQEQRMSLADQIMGIRANNSKMAQGLRSDELNRAEQIRQFNENLKFQREQAAAAERASRAASGGGFSPSMGDIFGGAGGGAAAGGAPVNKIQQQAEQNLQKILSGGKDYNRLRSDLLATVSSAQRGNKMDQAKLQLYRGLVQSQQIPDIFRAQTMPQNTALNTARNFANSTANRAASYLPGYNLSQSIRRFF
jgi:hypothetical protein